jgi:hypothetical protein
MPLFDVGSGKWVNVTPKPSLTAREGGPLRIWKRPIEGHRYVMGCDLAESGAAKADSTEFYVIDHDAREVVAHYQDKAIPNFSLAPCRMISSYYNDAFINVETNNQSGFVQSLTETDRLPFLFFRLQDSESAAVDKPVMEYGWKTLPGNKKDLVYILRHHIENSPALFADKHLIDDLLTFKMVRAETNTNSIGQWRFPGAIKGSGSHDDSVIAMAIALVADRDIWWTGPNPLAKKEEVSDIPSVGELRKGHIEHDEKKRLEEQPTGWT